MGKIRILRASAGSGKTYRLAYEYIKCLVDEPFMYRHILAVTFTNKATEEMKSRILRELNDLACGKETSYMKDLLRKTRLSGEIIRQRASAARTAILHDFSRFSILTIDKFFQRIIRSFIRELGIDLDFTLELRTDSILSEATDRLIEEGLNDPELAEWIVAFLEQRIEDGKKWDLKQTITGLGSELFGEFSLNREENLSKKQLAEIVGRINKQASAVTGSITVKAKQALDLIYGNGLEITDLNYGTSGPAGYFLKIVGGQLTDYGARVRSACVNPEVWYSKKSPRRRDIEPLSGKLTALISEICATYDSSRALLHTASIIRSEYRNFALLSDLARQVSDVCAERNIMPISKTNTIINKLVSDNDTPFIFEKTGSWFSRFMIDEFQDTSSLQWKNFVPLLRNAVAQSPGSPVLIVGDVKQSIYRWRSGDWRILQSGIEQEFPEVEMDDLTTNYRSRGRIVEFNNNLIRGCVETGSDTLDTLVSEAYDEGKISRKCRDRLIGTLFSTYSAHRQESVPNRTGGYSEVLYYDINDEEEFVPPVIETVEDLQRRGFRPRDISILVRNNSDAARIASLLLARKRQAPDTGFSYDFITQQALTVGNSDCVNFIIDCFHLAADGSSDIRLASYNRYLNRSLNETLGEEDVRFLRKISMLTLEEAFDEILIRHGLPRSEGDTVFIQELHQQIINFGRNSVGDILSFLTWWDETGSAQAVYLPPGADAMTIITIHKSKGLQYKAVVIPYCNWNMSPDHRSRIWGEDTSGEVCPELGKFPMPYQKNAGNSVFAEEFYTESVLYYIDSMNLLYVAITRAIDELYIMIPGKPGDTKGRVSSLITSCIGFSEDTTATIGSLRCGAETKDIITKVTFGEKTLPAPAREAQEGNFTIPYLTSSPWSGIKLRTRIVTGLPEDEPGTPDPRESGIILHGIFENALTIQDIYDGLETAVINGAISSEESDQLCASLADTLDHPEVREWFAGEWDEVRSEADIIVPGLAHGKRPDRVMVKGTSAVVVDYKFGLGKKNSYAFQVRDYINLLTRMGYNDVRGYIWYISTGEVERVMPKEATLFDNIN